MAARGALTRGALIPVRRGAMPQLYCLSALRTRSLT